MASAFSIGRYLGRHFPQVLGWGTLVLGLGAISFGELRMRYQLKSLHWPSTPGAIMQAGLGRRTTHYGRMRQPRSFYYADVTYTYQVADKRYVANQISLANPDLAGERGEEARGFLAAYPAHSSVDVYYDPKHPEVAILMREVDESQHAVLRWCGGGMILVAIWTLISSRKACARLRAKRKPA
jgi:hypothetical protein